MGCLGAGRPGAGVTGAGGPKAISRGAGGQGTGYQVAGASRARGQKREVCKVIATRVVEKCPCHPWLSGRGKPCIAPSSSQ